MYRMKGITFSTIVTVLLVLIVFSIIVYGLYTINVMDKTESIMKDNQIKSACSHFTCSSGCCDEDGGKNYNEQACTKNKTHTFRDRCSDVTGSKVGSTHVVEYYCNGNKIEVEVHKCSTFGGCIQGACS